MTMRLETLLETFTRPSKIIVFSPDDNTDFSIFKDHHVEIVTPMKPFIDSFTAQGLKADPLPEGLHDLSVVFLPRSKKQAYSLIETASRLSNHVIVDGQKYDGIDSVIKAVKKRTNIGTVISKSHGKAAIFASNPSAFQDWKDLGLHEVIEGFKTQIGIFSYDRIDSASQLLMQSIPDTALKGHIGDFGAGWGYMSKIALENPAIKTLSAIEADYNAYICAKENLHDTRSSVIWADARSYRSAQSFDTILMNPPFHVSRAADPSLGQEFIRNAARNLKPKGSLWLVANRQLPYETCLKECFKSVQEVGGSKMFKIIHATFPTAQSTHKLKGEANASKEQK